MTDTVVDFTAGVPVRGDLNVRWIHGSPPGRRVSEPKFQVHACDPHTYLLRQSKTVSFEAPFLYLLFGNERALLLDTGARKRPSASPLRATIDKLIAGWLHQHPRQGYQLVVAHTLCTPARRPIDPATRRGPTVAGAGHRRMPVGPMPLTNRARGVRRRAVYGDGHRIAPGRPRNLPFATSATWPPTSIRAISPAEPRGSTCIWLGRPVKRPW
jgi:hypothetical protein